MTITNNLNIPEFLFKALTHREQRVYQLEKSDISVTDMLNAPQIRILKKRHYLELEQDASDLLWMKLGEALHTVFSEAFVAKKIHIEITTLDDSSKLFTVIYEKYNETGNLIKLERELFYERDEDKNDMDSNAAYQAIDRAEELETFNSKIIKIDSGRYESEKEYLATLNGWKVKGIVDLDDKVNKAIIDFKYTSVWSYILGDKWEWTTQLNYYRYLMYCNGEERDKLYNVAIFRDWKKREAENDSDYPPHKFMLIPQEVYPLASIQESMLQRVILHQNADKDSTPDYELPLCTQLEKWEKPTTYAVKKAGAKRATRVYATDLQAHEHLEREPGLEIEKRVGVATRCLDYCPVNKFCFQFKREHTV